MTPCAMKLNGSRQREKSHREYQQETKAYKGEHDEKDFGKAMIMAAGFVLAACSATRQEAATMLVNYTDDSIYNVHGVRLTLAEYQAAMNVTLKQANIQMGDFQNIIICDDWAAIHFRVIFTDAATRIKTPSDIMQFYHFVEDGDAVRADMCWSSGR